MDANAVRSFVNEHPQGVRIKMVDGTVYNMPHRDYVWFTPGFGQPEGRVGRLATSFWLYDAAADANLLVNALLVTDLAPLKRSTKGKGRKRKGAA